ncbi:MAG TPA: hypothetical protein VL201_00760 [Patescibacteria group bacterium]|nr:hypothetical protein [Patescibacteria group bacterium]
MKVLLFLLLFFNRAFLLAMENEFSFSCSSVELAELNQNNSNIWNNSKISRGQINVEIPYTFSSGQIYLVLHAYYDKNSRVKRYSGLTIQGETDEPVYLFDYHQNSYSFTKVSFEKMAKQYLTHESVLVNLDRIKEVINDRIQENEYALYFVSKVTTNSNETIILDDFFVSEMQKLIQKNFDFHSLSNTLLKEPCLPKFPQSSGQFVQQPLSWRQSIVNWILSIFLWVKFW